MHPAVDLSNPVRTATFPPPRRLRVSREFGRVFAQPLRSSDGFFTVLARANDLSFARLGLAISRKAAKHAVDRNRLKRLARETFRQLALPPADYVILARSPAVGTANASLRESLDSHFVRLTHRLERRSHG